MNLNDIQNLSEKIKENVQKVVVGKGDTIDLLLVALISSGHVLLEDVPGTGKTLLAKSIAKSLDCSYRRIQFTPDLLPTDVTGLNIYNQKEGVFEFRPGAIFSNIVLADEINRATPRTQSSLLECMEERQVTIDGETRLLGKPFLVIATQNPIESHGTFPLPEAQLDRFLMKINLGYPSKDESISILKRFKGQDPLKELSAVVNQEEIIAAQLKSSEVFVSDAIFEYIINIIESSRHNSSIALGVSPRGSQALLKAVQAYAAIQGRDFVEPDDVKKLAIPVLAHRLVLKQTVGGTNQAKQVLSQLMNEVEVPAEKVHSNGSRGK